MSKKKVSDFQIMQRIADEDIKDGIAMFPDLIRGNLTKKGGEITFGIPSDALQWTLKGTHYFMAFAIKKEDYARIRQELENA